MLEIISKAYVLILYVIVITCGFTILLLLLRYAMNSLDVNPFTWHALMVRRLSDPLLNPVRRGLRNTGLAPKYVPPITIVIVIVVGWFTLELVQGFLTTIAGILGAATAGNLSAVTGHVLYGLLSLYGLMIFLRIILSWGTIGHRNRPMRFLINATDPLLVPLRKRIPQVGVFDISPMVAFIIILVLQAAVQAIFLR